MTYRELILSHGPSNFWSLNESSGLVAADSAGSAPGTISGGVTLAQPGALADGTTAMLFNGTTGQIVTASVTLQTPWTIEAWVKTTEMVAFPGHPYLAMPVPSNWLMGLWDGRPGFYDGTDGPVDVGGNIANGVWHQVVWVCAGGTSVALFIDGASRTLTQALTGAPPVRTQVLEMGKTSWGATFYTGSLDEVALSHRALSPTEIAEHYAARLVTGATDRNDLNTEIAAYLGFTTGSDLTTLVSVCNLKAHHSGDTLKDYQALIDAASV